MNVIKVLKNGYDAHRQEKVRRGRDEEATLPREGSA